VRDVWGAENGDPDNTSVPIDQDDGLAHDVSPGGEIVKWIAGQAQQIPKLRLTQRGEKLANPDKCWRLHSSAENLGGCLSKRVNSLRCPVFEIHCA
jgi:hypothetical protein